MTVAVAPEVAYHIPEVAGVGQSQPKEVVPHSLPCLVVQPLGPVSSSSEAE